MKTVAETPFYREAFQILSYPFGEFYLFDSFVVSEIKKDVVFTWDKHAKHVVEDISNLYENNGSKLIYISNRVHQYSVVPSDWLKFLKYNYTLESYIIVSKKRNSILEHLFMGKKMKTFFSIEGAIIWAKMSIETHRYTLVGNHQLLN